MDTIRPFSVDEDTKKPEISYLEKKSVAKRKYKKNLDKFEDWVVFCFALDTQLTGSLKDSDIRVGLCGDHCFYVLDRSVHNQVCAERAGNHVTADIGG